MPFREAPGECDVNKVRYQLCSSARCVLDQSPGVVLDEHRGVIYRMNAVATHILQLLLAGSTVPDIGARVSCEFGITLARAEADVDMFLTALCKYGLLTELAEATSRP